MSREQQIIVVNVPEEKAERIIKDQELHKRKKVVMQAELTTIAPSGMLFNALSVASTELARLQRLSALGELTMADFKKYQILIQSLTKLSEENRLNKQVAHLDGLTEEQKTAKVLEAIDVLNITVGDDDEDE